MAKLHMFSVYDKAAGGFMRPMFCQSEGAALRMFQDEVNRRADDNLLNKHPEHFRLFAVGSFDDESGLVTAADLPHLVASADDVLIVGPDGC